MARKRFTTEQIIGMLREAEVRLGQGQSIGLICSARAKGSSAQPIPGRHRPSTPVRRQVPGLRQHIANRHGNEHVVFNHQNLHRAPALVKAARRAGRGRGGQITGERRMPAIGDRIFWNVPARSKSGHTTTHYCGDHVSELIAFIEFFHIFANNVDARARTNWFAVYRPLLET
jgi:hypothetical protein